MLHISWLIDLPKEKHIGFSMTVSLSYVTTHPLLQDRRVFITPNVEPDREMTENLIKAVHAQLGYGSTALELLSRWAHYTNLKYLMVTTSCVIQFVARSKYQIYKCISVVAS